MTDFMPKAVDGMAGAGIGGDLRPYLMGSRYSLENLKAEFLGLTEETPARS